MKKFFLALLGLLLMQTTVFAKDILQFDFPNAGWHKVSSPDGVESKKCYVPVNQTAENYTEMLIFYERVLKSEDISPMIIMSKQIGKDKNNYFDIVPQYIKKDFDDSIVTWCSQFRNTCAIHRAFAGKEGVILATYLNKSPHYSQNMFGQWSNILSQVKLYEPSPNGIRPNNLIEL